MAITNQERVGKALELFRTGLAPYVEREFANAYKDKALAEARRMLPAEDRINGTRAVAQWDAAVLLKVMWDAWNEVFGRTLGRAERSLVQELRDVRNRWAHQEAFTGDDAYRALDSVHRLLLAVSATQAEEVEKMKTALKRFSKLPVKRASILAPAGRRASRAFPASALSRESDFGVTSVN